MAVRKLAGVSLLALALAGGGCGDKQSDGAVNTADNDVKGSGQSSDGKTKGDKDESPSGAGAAGMMGSGSAGSPGSSTDEPAKDGTKMDPEGQDVTDTSADSKDGVTEDIGATEFVSADPSGGDGSVGAGREAMSAGGAAGSAVGIPATSAPTGVDGDFAESANDTAAAEPAGAQRSVERGDIFQVLGDGRILNFNQYRGVQIIDVRDPNNPVIEGRLRLNGFPVELYVVDNRAILLLNGYQNYYGGRDDIKVERREGGLVAIVDIADRAAPKLVDELLISGSINTSRLTREGDKSALYVAAQYYEDVVLPVDVAVEEAAAVGVAIAPPGVGRMPSGPSMKLTSFDVSTAEIAKRNEIELGGYVSDIQATTDVMMVASIDYGQRDPKSRVALVDISDPGGKMVLGAEVEAAGIVQNKFNMDVYNDVLRVVSGGDWNSQVNTVQTFNIRDLGNAIPVDSCDFGLNQQLFATLFVDERAFFVTYLRQDPFHAFSIDETGRCEEENEFIVSGWNDFFRAVEGDTRLIGIGKNDENRNSTVAVSLYDITDLSNPAPLLARDEVELDWSSSEASWDDRAFSVLEDAVSVQAADGTEETGLVLLPFEGYENDRGMSTYRTGVQIFTFSASTLTKRGEMAQATNVRRTFLTEEDIAANLSDEDLTLHDVSDPDEPEQLGAVEVAANYRRIFRYGDQVVRVKEPSGRRYYPSTPAAESVVEVLAAGADPDLAPAVASFTVPANATLKQVGDLLVSYQANSSIQNGQLSNTTTFTVYDLSNPSEPEQVGATSTDVLVGNGGFIDEPFFDIAVDCFDCGPYYGPSESMATSSALVFPITTPHNEFLGSQRVCVEHPSFGCLSNGAVMGGGVATGGASTTPTAGPSAPMVDGGVDADVAIAFPEPEVCTEYYSGEIRCTYDEDRKESCQGNFVKCDDEECEEIERDALPFPPERYCYQEENYRYWSSYRFEVLDLSDPTAPKMVDAIELPEEYQGTSARVFDDTLYFNSSEPIDVAGDARGFMKRYFQHIDLSTPAEPTVSKRVNIPGEVIAVDDAEIITRDMVWDEMDTESLLARLSVQDDKARLLAQRLFDEREVQNVTVDGRGRLLVNHSQAYRYRYFVRGPVWEEPNYRLSILSAETLKVLGEADLDYWASLLSATEARALYSVSGGVLMINVEDATKPVAQAYFPIYDYYSDTGVVVDGDRFVLAGGLYGVYSLSLDEANLAKP